MDRISTILLIFIKFYFINCRDDREFCSLHGNSLLKYNDLEVIEIKRCLNYYNYKENRCVSGGEIYLSGTCADPKRRGIKYENDKIYNSEFEECRNFPHLTDCTRYYKCTKYAFRNEWCEGGFHVNNITMKCEDVECDENSSESSKFKCDSENIGKRRYINCDRFLKCKPIHELAICPFGMSYNLESGECDLTFSENKYCNEESLAILDCPKTLNPLSFDPSLYYTCTKIEKVSKNNQHTQTEDDDVFFFLANGQSVSLSSNAPTILFQSSLEDHIVVLQFTII